MKRAKFKTIASWLIDRGRGKIAVEGLRLSGPLEIISPKDIETIYFNTFA